jgi:putative nucleotidyltransferase with HDIG domain
MPKVDGLQLISELRQVQPHATYMLVSGECDLELAMEAVNEHAVAYVITKPWDTNELGSMLKRGIEAYQERKWQSAVQRNIVETSRNLQDQKKRLEEALGRSETLMAEMLLNALDLRDHETRAHCRRVSAYALLLAQELGLRGHALVSIQQGALLHDVGKLGVPDSILLKPGPLTEEEWQVMRQHSELGAKMLDGFESLHGARDIVLQHHERWDGSGYPAGLSGTEICLGARIFSVADTIDAMLSDRPYRKALTFAQVYAEVTKNAGKQFDPDVVEAFKRIERHQWLEVRDTYPEEAEGVGDMQRVTAA